MIATSKSKHPIPAFDYLRKSRRTRKAEQSDEDAAREEKSIAAQRRELDHLGFPQELSQAGYDTYTVVDTFSDVGVPGWKLGPKRPGFEQMFQAIKAHPAKHKVIRVDNMDRFSRADIDTTAEVIRDLKKAGVKWIVSAADGVFHVGHSGNDLVEVMKVAFACFRSHAYCQHLSRRITIARLDAAQEHRRTGGGAPFGMAHEKKANGDGRLKATGRLVAGDPERVKVVRQIFSWFVTDKRSINWITKELNQRKVPAPRGATWYVMTVKVLLRCRAYRGDFTFNQVHAGQFFRIDERQKVVAVSDEDRGRPRKNTGGFVVKPGVYKPIVDPALFDLAQKRLNQMAKDRSRRASQDVYPLTGVLHCSCGAGMYGVTSNRKGDNPTVVYRCSEPGKTGKCEQWQVRQDFILPIIVRELQDGVQQVVTMLNDEGKKSAHRPVQLQAEKRRRMQRDREKLLTQIGNAEDALFDVSDKASRQSLDRKIQAKREELAGLDAELAVEKNEALGCDAEKVAGAKSLFAWWENFSRTAARVPVSWEQIGDLAGRGLNFNVDPESLDSDCFPAEPPKLLIDPAALSRALREIGVRVDLRWSTIQQGKRVRHLLDEKHIRIRLGQNGQYSGDKTARRS